MSTRTKDVLSAFYDALYAALGPQHWWPGKTPLEVIVGAILTQNTAWKNVERAIANLRAPARPADDLRALREEILALQQRNRALEQGLEELKAKMAGLESGKDADTNRNTY